MRAMSARAGWASSTATTSMATPTKSPPLNQGLSQNGSAEASPSPVARSRLRAISSICASRFCASCSARRARAVRSPICSAVQGERESSASALASACSASESAFAEPPISVRRVCTRKSRSCASSYSRVMRSSCSSRRTSSLPGVCMRCEGNSEDPSTKKAKDSAGGRPAWTRRNDWISRSSAVKSTNLRDPASYFCSSRMPPTSRTSRCGSLSWPTKPSASRGGTFGSSESFCRSSAAGKSAARIAGRIAGDLETTATYPGRKAIWPFAPSSLTRWYSSSVSCTPPPPYAAAFGLRGWRPPAKPAPSGAYCAVVSSALLSRAAFPCRSRR